MKYERLTKKNRRSDAIVDMLKSKYSNNTAIKRLAELEDKIENGTLVELPCKVGDMVYFIAKQGMDIYSVEKTIIVDFWCNPMENRFYPIDVNEIPINEVFLTKADAEKRLEELRGEAKEVIVTGPIVVGDIPEVASATEVGDTKPVERYNPGKTFFAKKR